MTEQKFLKELESRLWESANTLRSNISAAEYKHIALEYVFLKYVSDSFETRIEELKGEFTNPKSDYYLCDDEQDELVMPNATN